jgi:hypothetical protein
MSILLANFLTTWPGRIFIVVVIIALIIFLKWYRKRDV